MLNQAELLLSSVGYLVAGMAGLTVFLAPYSATIAQEQTIAIMRALGANRQTVFCLVLFEALIILLLGALLDRLLGYAAAFILATLVTTQSAIPIPIRFPPTIEPLLWLLSLGVGLFAALLPATLAYRVNITDNLFPT